MNNIDNHSTKVPISPDDASYHFRVLISCCNPNSIINLIDRALPVDDQAPQALLLHDVSLISRVESLPARISTEQSGGFAELEGVHDLCFVGYEEGEMELRIGVSHHICLLVQS
jgi:hypothetical protein